MWDPTENWAQQGSYVAPVVPPPSQPDDFPLVCIEINQLWIPYILGALQQLVQPTSWTQGAGPVTVEDAQDSAQDLIAIIGTAAVCHLAPDCAGMDAGHASTFALVADGDGAHTVCRVGAGRTAGGPVISYGGQDVDISAVAPGDVDLAVNIDGVVSAYTSGSAPGDRVVIAAIEVAAPDGHWYSDGTIGGSGITMYKDLTPTPIDPFVHGDPAAFPDPAVFDQTYFNNAATPVADYAGIFIAPATGRSRVITALDLPTLALPGTYAAGLTPVGVLAQSGPPSPAGGITAPRWSLWTVPPGTVSNLVDGVPASIFSFGSLMDNDWSPAFAVGNGASQYSAYGTLGLSFTSGYVVVAADPLIATLHKRFSSC